MIPVEAVVAIRADDERRDIHPAAEQPQHVERRLVAPVQVFDHEHRRLLRELVAQHREHLRRLDGGTEDVRERIALRGDVEQRPERAGSRERVTGSGEHASMRLEPRAEGADERGLAGAGLAADEDDPPEPEPRLVQRFGQQRKRVVPLEQLVGPWRVSNARPIVRS